MKMNAKYLMGAALLAAGCATGSRECNCGCDGCYCGREQPPICSAAETEEGFVPLYNGVDMTGWKAPKNGCYHAAPGGILEYRPDLGSGGMWTEREYGDFVLRFEFKLSCDCNNGLAVRCPKDKLDTYAGGFEIQMIDDEGAMYTATFPQLGLHHRAYQRHGAVYGVVPPNSRPDGHSYLNPAGHWNTQEVEMHGDHLRVVLNGFVIQDCHLDRYPIDGTSMDHAKHPGIRSRKGCFGWLSHGYPCWWRNIRIKECK